MIRRPLLGGNNIILLPRAAAASPEKNSRFVPSRLKEGWRADARVPHIHF